MAIAIDASTPAPTQATIATAGTIASAAITAPANSLIVVTIGCNATGLAVSGPPDAGITGVTGGGLTFTELAYAVQGSNCYCSIWAGYGSPPGGSVFTAQCGTGFGSTDVANLVPIVLTGAASVQNGGVATHNASTHTGVHESLEGSAAASPYAVTVAATAAGSLVIAVESNFTASTTPTPAGDQTITFNGHSSMCSLSGDGKWVQMEPTLTSGAGDVTISDTVTGHATLNIAMCAVEILAAAGAPAATAATFSVSDPTLSRIPGIH